MLGASTPRPSAPARAARANADHPTAHRKYSCPASHRRTLRRPQTSRAEPQTHPDARRTFHEPRRPPGTDAERACQGRAIQKPGVAPKPHRSAKASKDAMSPAQAAPSPPSPMASAQRASGAARAPREPVHTSQPLAGVCARPAPRRPTPRRARKSRAAPQAHPDARRTFHEKRRPPGVDAE
jgi:hypothetical protein